MTPARDEQGSRPSRSSRLDDAFREAVSADRRALSEGHPRRHKAEGVYEGYLSWHQLSALMEKRGQGMGLHHSWNAENIEKVFRAERGVPRQPQERQIFFEATQQIINECYDLATEKFAKQIPPPHTYSEFLGFVPSAPVFHELNFEPSTTGFIQIIDWNSSRRLTKDNIGETRRVEHEDREPQDWVPDELLNKYLTEERARDPGSPCPSLVGYIRDTREAQGMELVLDVTESQYHRHVAIRNCMRDHPHLHEQIMARIFRADSEGGFSNMIARSPDSNIVINVTVQSREGELLLVQRPSGQRTWANSFQVGPHETMNWPAPGAKFETCFDLAERALREEVGLEDPYDYYKKIVFSWFGYYLRDASAYFFAHVRTRLTRQQIVDRISSAESKWETGNIQWMWPTVKAIEPIIGTWRNGPWNFDADPLGRVWLPHSVLSLTQLHRVMRQGMLPPISQHEPN